MRLVTQVAHSGPLAHIPNVSPIDQPMQHGRAEVGQSERRSQRTQNSRTFQKMSGVIFIRFTAKQKPPAPAAEVVPEQDKRPHKRQRTAEHERQALGGGLKRREIAIIALFIRRKDQSNVRIWQSRCQIEPILIQDKEIADHGTAKTDQHACDRVGHQVRPDPPHRALSILPPSSRLGHDAPGASISCQSSLQSHREPPQTGQMPLHRLPKPLERRRSRHRAKATRGGCHARLL